MRGRLEVRGLTKVFRGWRRQVVALRGLDLEVAPGELFVVLGPSGCGKSTLLHLLAGLERPTQGEIWMDGRLVASPRRCLSPRERNVAMVFQSYALYPHLTAFENIAFPLRVARTPSAEVDRRVREVAEMLQVDDLLEARPAELSGGQRQRVALARALVRRPWLLLLDEPLSNLDALLRLRMREEIKELQRRLGVTTVYVTHDQAEAMTLGDRLALLRAGQLQQVGPPLEVYRRPANAFVAGFLGTPPMNLLRARAEGGGLRLGTHWLRVRGGLGGLEGELLLGVRPEDVRFGGGPNAVPAQVRMVERLGGEAIVHLRVPGGGGLLARVAPEAAPPEGAELLVQLPPERLHLFDAEGRRLELP